MTFHHGTGRVSNGPGRDFDSLFCRVTGQDTEQWDKKRERNKTIIEKKKYFDTYNFWAFQVLSLQSTKVDLGKDQ